MSPLISTTADIIVSKDLTGTKFGDMTGSLIRDCKLNNTDWTTAKVKGLHIHNCTGVVAKRTISICWTCGRFTSEAFFLKAIAAAFNLRDNQVVNL